VGGEAEIWRFEIDRERERGRGVVFGYESVPRQRSDPKYC
jgi:hypothetical protein